MKNTIHKQKQRKIRIEENTKNMIATNTKNARFSIFIFNIYGIGKITAVYSLKNGLIPPAIGDLNVSHTELFF